MKKFLISIVVLIILLLAAVYGLLFTSSGNKIVRNYAQNKINENVPGLAINELKITPSHLDLKLNYLDFVDVNFSGELKLASLSLNLVYTIDSKNLEQLNIKETIHADGTIVGKYSDLDIKGQGNIFTSPLKFSTRLLDFNPSALHLELKDADLSKLAAIANYPILKGNLSIIADAPDISQLNAKVNGNLEFLKEANKIAAVDINSLGKIDINGSAKSINNELLADLNLNSKILALNFTNIKYKDESLYADVAAKSSHVKWINPNLNTDLNLNAKLKKIANALDINAQITGKNLNIKDLIAQIDLSKLSAEASAKVLADAQLLNLPKSTLADAKIKAQLNDGKLSILESSGIALGGNLLAKLTNNRLSASLKHANIAQLLIISNAPHALNGYFDADLNVGDLAKLVGDLKLDLKGSTEPKYFKEIMNMPINSSLSANANIKLKGSENITFLANAKSELIDSLSIDGKLLNSTLDANYKTSAKLENFNRLLNKNMSGKIDLSGALKANSKSIFASTKSADFFGAALEAQLNNENFTASLQNANIPRFAKAFDFADIYAANANAKINYNLKTARGSIHADLAQGHLQPHPVLKLIDAISGSSIDKIVFNQGKFDSIITPASASIEANLSATNAALSSHGGSYTFANKTLNAPIELKLNTTTIKGALKGSQNQIKFIPDAKNTAENIFHLVDKLSGKKGANETAQPNNKPNAEALIKGILGGIKK